MKSTQLATTADLNIPSELCIYVSFSEYFYFTYFLLSLPGDVLCEKLRQSGANITDVDKLCVQVQMLKIYNFVSQCCFSWQVSAMTSAMGPTLTCGSSSSELGTMVSWSGSTREHPLT